MMVNVKEPEWTAENMNRQEGATDFVTCGWCKHASGTCRYGCTLEGSCSLLRKDYGDNEEADVQWDTKCKIVGLGKGNVQDIIADIQYKINSMKSSIKYREKELEGLEKILESEEEKPVFVRRRNAEYFNINDRVRVFFTDKDWEESSTLEPYATKLMRKWILATVVSGYRHHDGCVSYVADSIPDTQKGWGFGVAVPKIIHEWEYQYFLEHPEYWEKWKADAEKESYNGTHIELKGLDGEVKQ